jgi:hypothetical protein
MDLILLLFLIPIGLFVRNFMVWSFRDKLISQIAKANRVANYGYGHELWDEFETVSYHKMIWKFWKPLKSFYKGTKLEVFV